MIRLSAVGCSEVIDMLFNTGVRAVCVWALVTMAMVTSWANGSFLDGGSPDFSVFTEPSAEREPVQVELIAENRTIQADRPFWVALHADVKPGWKTYWRHSGDSGMATSVEWILPEGFKVNEEQWPTPERFESNDAVSFGYSQPFTILAQITPPKNLKKKQPVDLAATMRWVACNESNCIPGDCDCELAVDSDEVVPQPQEDVQELFRQARSALPNDTWEAEAQVAQNSLLLTIKPPQYLKSLPRHATFFPSKEGIIDYHQPVTIESDTTAPEAVTLRLSRGEQTQALPSHLKGVVVLDNAEAITVTAPIYQEDSAPLASADLDGDFIEFEGGIGTALLLAFVCGIILNLMPCVLPVISLKVLSIVKMSGQSRAQTVKHGLFFALGVLASFWALAAAILALQAYGHMVGWGFQLQEPLFVGILAAVLVVFSMSLFGVFEFGTDLAAWAGQKESETVKQSSGYSSSFFNGILATAVATPCTGPFLGSALGFAVTLPPISALSIFTSLGLGMALPYMLLTAFPNLVKWLPKPGAWMVTFKQLMGFLLLGTVLWLGWVFGAQTDNNGVFLLLSALFLIAVATWVYGRYSSPLQKRSARLAGGVVSAGIALLGVFVLVVSSQVVPEDNEQALARHLVTGEEDLTEWLPFSPEVVQKYREEGRPVFIDFTAKWCVICQTNHFVLTTDEVEQALKENGVVKFKADWTRPNPAITKELRKYGRSGVPLYLLYLPGKERPIVLPQVLTPEIVLSSLRELDSTRSENSTEQPVAEAHETL